MILTFATAVYGHFGHQDYYLTTIKTSQALQIIEPAANLFDPSTPEPGTPTRTTSKKRPGRSPQATQTPPPIADIWFHSPLIVGIQDGDPVFLPIEVTESPYIPKGTDLQMGILHISEPNRFLLLSPQTQLESIRKRNQPGRPDTQQDDIPVMLIEHQDTPEGREKFRQLAAYLTQQGAPR